MLDPQLLFWMYEIEQRWFVNRNELTGKDHRKFQAKTEIMYNYIKHPFLIFSCIVEREKGGIAEEGECCSVRDRAL